MRINLFISSSQKDSFVKVSIEALFDNLNNHLERLAALEQIVSYLNEKCFQLEPIIKPIPGYGKVETEFQDTRFVFAPPPAHLIPFLVRSGSTLDDLQKLLNPILQIHNIYYGVGLEGKLPKMDTTFGNLAGIVAPSTSQKFVNRM